MSVKRIGEDIEIRDENGIRFDNKSIKVLPFELNLFLGSGNKLVFRMLLVNLVLPLF